MQVDPRAALLPVLARLESGQVQQQARFDHQPKEQQERLRVQVAESVRRSEQAARSAVQQELCPVHCR